MKKLFALITKVHQQVLLLIIFLFYSSNILFSQYTYHCGGDLLHCHGVNGCIDAEYPLIFGGDQSITLVAWVRCEVKNPSNMGIVYRKFIAHQPNPTIVEWGIVLNAQGQFMFRGAIDTAHHGRVYHSLVKI